MHARSPAVRPCSSRLFPYIEQTLPQFPPPVWPREKSATRRTMLALTMGLMSRFKGKDSAAAAINGHTASPSNAADQDLLGNNSPFNHILMPKFQF